MGSSYRLTVLTLAKESYTHRINLEKLLKTLGLEVSTNEIPEVTFDFVDMLPSEILLKIVDYDELARELYSQILEKFNSKIFLTLFRSKDNDFFYKTIKQMIDDETKHISMVRKVSGLIERIQ